MPLTCLDQNPHVLLMCFHSMLSCLLILALMFYASTSLSVVVEIFISWVFCHYFFYDDWCIAIIYVMYCHPFPFMLRFFPIAFMSCLVNTNLCVKCARYLDELSLLCVPLYLWDTTFAFNATYLVPYPWAPFCIFVCFACLVLSCRRFMWLCPLHTICDLFSHWSSHAYVGCFDFWLVSFDWC